MFKKYYVYVMLSTAKKKSVWIVNGLVWLFYALILFIIPAPLKISPLFLWTNSMFNMNLMTVIFISMYCAILAVLIFNQPKEDGSELLIISKPISRWKIISCKFWVFMSFVLINMIVNLIIPLFCLCLGEYNASTKPGGFESSKLGDLEFSIFIATLVICLFFGAIAILISMKGNKPVIMVSTIAIAIVFELISMMLPIIVKSPATVVTDRHGVELTTSNYYDRYHKRARSFMMADDGLIGDDKVFDGTTKYWNNIAQKESGLAALNSLDVGGQLASLYKLFSLSGDADSDIGAYGMDSTIKYVINNNDLIFDYFDPTINPTNIDTFTPMIYPNRTEDNTWEYQIFGIDTKWYLIYKALGCMPNSIFIIDDKKNKLDSKFIGGKEFDFSNSSGDDIISDHNDDGAKEYASIRNELISEVLDPSKNLCTDDYVAQAINNFLCNPITSFKTSEQICDSGYEAVTGKETSADITDIEWSIAFAKVLIHIDFDMWDFFYGRINSLDMSKDLFSDNQNPFISKLIEQFNSIHPGMWTLSNGQQVNNDDFFNKYRFLFYKNSLDYLLDVDSTKEQSLFRFFAVMNLETLRCKNIQGFVTPDFSSPTLARTSNFELNTLRNTIPNISSLKTSAWYTTRKYVTNVDTTIVWTIFAIVLFTATYTIYWRTDIK